jgi:N-acetylglucosamine kinase-like BadF-type ATPase
VSQVEKRRALEILGAFFPSARLEARPDYHAIAATAGREISATAISGTGTVVTGWSNGEIVKTGGGGPLIGDDGSTYHMGKLALRALINGNEEALGFEPLLASMEEIFGSRIPHEVVTEVYQSPSPAASLAKLAPSVAAAEQAGLVFGKEIAATVLDHLSGLIDLHIDRFNPEALSVRIAVAGGLFKVDPTYSERLFAPELGPFSQRASVKRRYSTQPLEDEPILGAARLAKRLSQDLSTT